MCALKKQSKLRLGGGKYRDQSPLEVGLLFLGVCSVELKYINVGIHHLPLIDKTFANSILRSSAWPVSSSFGSNELSNL